LAGRVGGISFNARQARTALTQLQQLGRQNAVVYLPSHDPLSAERLANRRRTLITP
jgi:glyoxylase-like metal-dependent hydrolase (beta-lactamase superfamily II)